MELELEESANADEEQWCAQVSVRLVGKDHS